MMHKTLIHKMVSKLDQQIGFATASAHCDIPCKIYDPGTAQIAALTMLRMVDLINELQASDTAEPMHSNSMVRYISIKEEHGIKLKEEIRIIWGDYIKAPQMEKFPEINDLTHEIMMAASAAKQHVDRDKTLQLIDKVNRFAEIFWATKGVATKRATCPYPPAVEMIYPDL